MKPISKNRKPRSLFGLDPSSCALPPKKVLVPHPESVPTAIFFYCNPRLQPTLLFSHQARRSIAHLMPHHRPY